MEDSFQFIIESPQHNTGHKKRPRLVTSCSSSPALSSHSNNRSNSHSPKASGMVSPEGDPNNRYPSYPPDPRRPADPSHRHGGPSSAFQSRNDPGYYHSPTSHSRPPLYPSNSRHVHLFDPEQPQSPHPMLMQTFVQIFFEHVGPEFPFLIYDQINQEVWDRRLPLMVSNVIAAIASRYADNIPELTVRGLHNVSETYLDNAKTIGNQIVHTPSMDTLHALILLTWWELRMNRISSFRSYAASMMRMGMDLGLTDQDSLMMLHEKERARRRHAWEVAYRLNGTVTPYDR
ncbi:hypothetical protein H0H93_007911 [Arthromyces matolae]|nr:hypothetical protein H0H93_007911 [Arthromyces matolae]